MPVQVSKLAEYAVDPAEYIRWGGGARDRAAVAAGLADHARFALAPGSGEDHLSEDHGHYFDKFKLPRSEFEILGSDLPRLSNLPTIRLIGDGLIGVPDIVFRSRDGSRIRIGERKGYSSEGRPAWQYAAGNFQTILYMGLARQRWGAEVTGSILYYDGELVDVPWDASQYRWLVSLIPEFLGLPEQGATRAPARGRPSNFHKDIM